MQVKITVEAEGQKVTEQVVEVSGTLAQMEEAATILGRTVACQALQAAVDAVPRTSPLFRRGRETGETKASKREPSSA